MTKMQKGERELWKSCKDGQECEAEMKADTGTKKNCESGAKRKGGQR